MPTRGPELTPARDADAADGGTATAGPVVEDVAAPAPQCPAAGLLAVLVAAFVVVATMAADLVVALRHPRWPILDQAIISWRSLDVFSGVSPLAGQLTQACRVTGRPVFSPGPLLYWVLAVPVHLSPRSGAVVGAVLTSAVAAVVALLAVARVASRVTLCVLTAALLLLLHGTVPAFGVDPSWNPYAPLVPFAACLIVGWVVARGHLGWLALLVLLASFCIQAHLMFGPAAAAVLLVAPSCGLLLRRRRRARDPQPRLRGPLLAAGGAVLLCWTAPVVQQLTQRHGNLGLLVRGTFGSSSPTLGYERALRNLSRAVAWPPVWLGDTKPTYFSASGRPVLWSLVALALLVAFGVWASLVRHADLLAAVLVVLVADLGVVVAISGVSAAGVLSITYVQYVLWPVGIATWLVLLYGVVEVGRRAMRRPAPRVPTPGSARLALTAGVAVVAVAAVVIQYRAVERTDARERPSTVAAGAIADRVVSDLGAPPADRHLAVALPQVTSPRGDFDPALLYGLAYRLRVAGWQPAVADSALWGWNLDEAYWPKGPMPVLLVRGADTGGGQQVSIAPGTHAAPDPATRLTSPLLGDPWVRGGSCG